MNKLLTSFHLRSFVLFRSATVPSHLLLGWLVFVVVVFGAEINSRHLLAALNRGIGLMLLAALVQYYLPEILHRTGQRRSMQVNPKSLILLIASVPVLATPLVVAMSYYVYPVPNQLPWYFYYEGLVWHLLAFAILGWTNAFGYGRGQIFEKPGSMGPSRNFLSTFTVASGRKKIYLKTLDISHFQADGDYIRVFSDNKSYLIRKKISELSKELDPSSFQRIHRSYIINLAFVQELCPKTNGDYKVVLINGASVKMSRSYNHVIDAHMNP